MFCCTYHSVYGHDFAENDTRPDRMSICHAVGDLTHRRTHLIKFLVRIRGALTPPPRMDAPVTKIPLQRHGELVISPSFKL